MPNEFFETMRSRAEALRRHKSLEPAPEYKFEPEVIEPERTAPLRLPKYRPTPFPSKGEYQRIARRPAQEPGSDFPQET